MAERKKGDGAPRRAPNSRGSRGGAGEHGADRGAGSGDSRTAGSPRGAGRAAAFGGAGGAGGARGAGGASAAGSARYGAGYRGSSTGYKKSGTGGSYRSGTSEAPPTTSRGLGQGSSPKRGSMTPGSKATAPRRISGEFAARSPRGGNRGFQNGGWNRPAPRRGAAASTRRDGLALPRRETPAGREQPSSNDESEHGPLPSSIGRAATTGRNLWPRPPRGRQSEPSRGQPRGPAGGSRDRVRSLGGSGAVAGRAPGGSGFSRSAQAGKGRKASTKPFVARTRPLEVSDGRGTAKVRRALGGDQVEGRQAVRELLSARRRGVHEVWMMEGSDPAAILREIESLARTAHVPVRLVTSRQIQQAQGSEAPQGVIAFAEPLTEADLSELVGLGAPDPRAVDAPARAKGLPFLVVVDGVTDPQNLGALLRSADCAGVTGVVLPRHRSAHVTPTVAKVAAGAVEHVRITVVPGVPGALQELERLGVLTVGLDERGPEPLFQLQLGDQAIALVVGAEGRGLAPLSRQRCDVLARIPLHGSIDSLNVSAAGAVAMFEVARQRAAIDG